MKFGAAPNNSPLLVLSGPNTNSMTVPPHLATYSAITNAGAPGNFYVEYSVTMIPLSQLSTTQGPYDFVIVKNPASGTSTTVNGTHYSGGSSAQVSYITLGGYGTVQLGTGESIALANRTMVIAPSTTTDVVFSTLAVPGANYASLYIQRVA
jgi:hypothetical protein